MGALQVQEEKRQTLTLKCPGSELASWAILEVEVQGAEVAKESDHFAQSAPDLACWRRSLRFRGAG